MSRYRADGDKKVVSHRVGEREIVLAKKLVKNLSGGGRARIDKRPESP
jgi:hypothetical protein